ncbi:MAG: inositol monophosphatase [Deltaproteobacteria bacterium]|nr:MAG: inositol monophosphatase [Deltaproteobacteria bacterium]
MNDELRELLADAVEVARRAGGVLRKHYGKRQNIHFKGEIDLVTDVDRESEALIVDFVQSRYRGHSILAEESKPLEGEGEYRWIIDPLDGTTNYAHGYPFFCVSVAVEKGGEVVVGVVYDPLREECFTGVKGGGAFLNGEPVRVSRIEKLRRALLATGFPYDIRESQETNIDYFEAYARSAQAIRRDGSAALDLCYLACGRFDGFWELKLKPWDTAAGYLIVLEAGGMVTGLSGEPYSIYDGDVLGSNGLIHAQMLEVAESVRRRRS